MNAEREFRWLLRSIQHRLAAILAWVRGHPGPKGDRDSRFDGHEETETTELQPREAAPLKDEEARGQYQSGQLAETIALPAEMNCCRRLKLSTRYLLQPSPRSDELARKVLAAAATNGGVVAFEFAAVFTFMVRLPRDLPSTFPAVARTVTAGAQSHPNLHNQHHDDAERAHACHY